MLIKKPSLYSSIHIILVFICFLIPGYANAISYGTVTDGESCGSVYLTGFSTIEEAGLAAWDEAWCVNQQFVYGNIVEFHEQPWWAYATTRDGEILGTWKYYRIYEDPYYYVLTEPPSPFTCNDVEGNPCNPGNGNKIQTFTDYRSSNSNTLIFKRIFLSQNDNPNQFSKGWQHNYSSRMNPKVESEFLTINSNSKNSVGLQQSELHSSAESACLDGWQNIKNKAFRGTLANAVVQFNGGNICHVLVDGQIVATLTIQSSSPTGLNTSLNIPLQQMLRSNGNRYFFQQQGEQWTDPQHPEVSLVAEGIDWLFTDAQDIQERYNEQGKLLQITTQQGLVTELDYDLSITLGGDDNPDSLDKVMGPFGRTLLFTYQDDNLMSVNTPDGLISYTYDNLGNLIEVIYPDNSTEKYHYENRQFPHFITGITDENESRFANWDYDNQGRVILSEHAGQNERVTFVYNEDGTTDVTDALGATRKYTFEWERSELKVKKITGDYCSTCANGSMKERTYNSNGYINSYVNIRLTHLYSKK